jgi:hypothetical protein
MLNKDLNSKFKNFLNDKLIKCNVKTMNPNDFFQSNELIIKTIEYLCTKHVEMIDNIDEILFKKN